MVKLKKTAWSQVTIAEYKKIMDICKDEGLSDTEKDVAVIAILAEVPEDEIWELQVEEVRKLRSDMLFLSTEITHPKTLNFKKIKIGDTTCKVLSDLQKMTYAQFVDFQTYIKDIEKNKAEILSVFFIPEGHKYNDGYDLSGLQREIEECVSIETFRTCWFFFLLRYRSLLKDTAISLASKLRVRSWMMKKSNPLKEKYRELAKVIKGIPRMLG